MDKPNDLLWFAVMACLTLGLAPFYPEPHLFGKIRWVMGGANGMKWIDWWDLVMHGSPWIFLMFLMFRKLYLKFVDAKKS